jgi:hypothetical protein
MLDSRNPVEAESERMMAERRQLPVDNAVHGSVIPILKGCACARVALETNQFDTAPEPERETVFPR